MAYLGIRYCMFDIICDITLYYFIYHFYIFLTYVSLVASLVGTGGSGDTLTRMRKRCSWLNVQGTVDKGGRTGKKKVRGDTV